MSKRFKLLKEMWVKDKLVLVRLDLNSDVKGKKVLMSERINECVKTIDYLKREGARIVILAHQGNPKKSDFLSLRQHSKLLNNYTKVRFVEDIVGRKAINAIKRVKSGEAILLENVRFVKDEFNPKKKNNSLLKLAPLFDLYVNDAFSNSHRDHTSMTMFPKLIESCAGLLVEKELEALERISVKDCLYVLGGAKPESNIKLLKGNKVLSCGLFGQMCLVSQGKDLGYQNKFLRKATLVKRGYKEFLSMLKRKLKNVEMPVDFAVDFHGKRKEFGLEEFPLDYEIEDIGKKTMKRYIREIKKAKSIYMKGPAGFAAETKFSKGTVKILKAISKSKGFSLVGGGHLSDVIEKYKINKKKFDHVSLSGGALLNFVAGEKLPGLKVLGYYGS